MVYLAEEGLRTEGRCFDHAWQVIEIKLLLLFLTYKKLLFQFIRPQNHFENFYRKC